MRPLRQNSIINTGGSLVRLIIGVATQPALIVLLGTERFGQWTVLFAAASLAGTADLGIGSALTVLLPSRLKEEMKTVGTALMLGTVQAMLVAACWLVFSNVILNLIFGATQNGTETVYAFRILAFIPLFGAFALLLQGWEAGLRRYDITAKAETAGALLQNASLIGVSFFTKSLAILAFSLVLTRGVTLLIHIWLLHRAGKPLYAPVWHDTEARILLRFGVPYWFSTLSSSLFMNADRIIVNRLLGVEAVALYSLATSIVGKINEVSALPIRPIIPEVAGNLAQNRVDAARAIFRRAIEVNGAMTFVLAAGILWASRPVAHFVSPTRIEDVTLLLRVMSVIYAVYSLAAPGYFVLIAARRVREVAFWSWAGTVSTLALIVKLSPLGLLGAAAANTAYSLIGVANLRAAKMLKLPVRDLLLSLSRPLCCVLAAFVLVSALKSHSILVAMAGFACSVPVALMIDRTDALRLLRRLATKATHNSP